MENKEKLEGYKFWEKLGRPTKLVAPMVDQSELAWRMLSRKYGAELCYTPMLHASVFLRDPQYRIDGLASCPEDRPLIVQFCANDPDILTKSALLAQDHCDAVDINLGCPQTIAKRGNYGAFLGENWELVTKLIKACHEKLSVPVTCKIRIFTDVEKTVQYAKMIERAGCQLLTVHGRTKEMKGPMTGLASWEHIKAVKDAVKIPVFANGNIQYKADVDRCINQTGVDGVMIAEGNLHDPCLFVGKKTIIWEIALEYLQCAVKYPCPASYARGHVFKICHHGLQRHTRARDLLASSKDIQDMKTAVEVLRDICTQSCGVGKENSVSDDALPMPHWFCQPYVRPAPKPKENRKERPSSTDSGEISKKKLKKMMKRCMKNTSLDLEGLDSAEKVKKLSKIIEAKPNKVTYDICVKCGNPSSTRCVFHLCKPCCKIRAKEVYVFCTVHRNFVPKTKQGNLATTDANLGKEQTVMDHIT
nr:tRNA-dihydrouridine(16/17) synthase [NAD(P)(+)]-like [Ciona intestinalis]|eukprot:XP_002123151.1 tRNA-dihydrouridine(16/17) synthase [NAD(P)(+)]-like [Ciona intestinalis]